MAACHPICMSKNSMWFICGLVTLFSLSGCLGKIETQGSGDNSSPKALLSRWYTSNAAWSVDLTGGNVTGSSFTGHVIYSDSSTCNCTFSFTGSDASGSYTASCVNPLGTTGMAGSNCPNFDTVSSPTYSNSGGTLSLCHNGGSCITYYP
jgi:hypothetical protein